MIISYDARLVLLSIAVAILASYTSLSLSSRTSGAIGSWRTRAWLAGGAVSMGTGIWSMHFVGMLAARLPVRMTYSMTITLASLLIAIVASRFALGVVRGTTVAARNLVGGAILMGTGIASMHYVGMAAMQIAPGLTYRPALFAASVAIAIGASGAALWLAFWLRTRSLGSIFWKRFGSALLMGLGISAMHYVGMAATEMAPGSICTAPEGAVDSIRLGFAVGIFSFLFLLATLAVAVLDDHLAMTKIRHSVKVNDELERRVGQRTAQLQFANEELERFAFSVAHDLRAPLIAIAGFGGLLKGSLAGDPNRQRRHYLDRIEGSIGQMTAMIDAFLAITEISRTTLHWERVDLGALARAAIERLRGADPLRDVDLSIDDDLMVQGDSSLLKILIDHLVDNAWKFSSRKARAHVHVGHETGSDGHAVFFVRDDGAGFDMAYAENLFKSFHRLHSTQDFPGTGVGLVQVKRIVERHGGRVWTDARPGHGATFYFTLGTQEPSRPAASASVAR